MDDKKLNALYELRRSSSEYMPWVNANDLDASDVRILLRDGFIERFNVYGKDAVRLTVRGRGLFADAPRS